MPKVEWRRGQPLSEELQERLRVLIRERGEKKTAELLSLSVISIARAALGCGTREGTRLLIQMRLRALDEAAA